MLEYFTEALVLDNKDKDEWDAWAILYTRDFGKISAKVKSAKKISSKLNSHLQPLKFVDVRLIVKNNFQVVDALSYERALSYEKTKGLINILDFVDAMTWELQPEPRLWAGLKKIFRSDYTLDESKIYRGMLKIFGFDPDFAECYLCGGKPVSYFDKNEHIFFCERCFGRSDRKIEQNVVRLIGKKIKTPAPIIK